MAIKESIAEGMRLTHTTHGDGRVQTVIDRISPKTKAMESYATVSFSSVSGKVSWSSLVHNAKIQRNTDTSLTLMVAVDDIANGPNWFLANDYGDLSDIIVDIERLGTKNSAVTPINFSESSATQITTLGKNLERADLSPEGDPINILKIITDWSAERLVRQVESSHSRSVALRCSEMKDWIALMEENELWSSKLYPSLPEAIKVGTERVLVSVAGLISCEHEVEMHEAARILTDALENRVSNIHARAFRLAQSRLEAQASKIDVN